MEAKKRKNAHPRLQPETFFFPFFVLLEEGEREKKEEEDGGNGTRRERFNRRCVCGVCARVCVFSIRALVSLNVAPPGGRSGPIV